MNPAPSICSSRTFGYIQKVIKMNVSKVRDSKNYLGNIKQILNKSNIGIVGYIKN